MLRAYALGATATLSFAGTRAAWISTMASTGGLAEVSIDGVVVTTVDLYSPGGRQRVVVFQSAVLAPGPHTLTVRALGDHSVSSTGNRVDIDGFIVIP